MGAAMEKIYKNLLFAVCCLYSALSVNANPNIFVKNETKWPIFVDDCQTHGSIVTNGIDLIGSSIENNKQIELDIVITSRDCSFNNNFVDLCLFDNTKEEYYPVRISWNAAFSDHNYKNDKIFRITKKGNHGTSVFYTFLNADEFPQLSKSAGIELKQDQYRQQQIGIETIKKDFGLNSNDELTLSSE